MREGGGRGGEWVEGDANNQDTFQAPAGSGRGQRSGGGGGDWDLGGAVRHKAPAGSGRGQRSGGGGGEWVAVCAREQQNICGRHAPPIKGAAGRTHSAVEP